MVLFPILAAILQAGSVTFDKVALNIKKVTYKTYTSISFPLIFIITLAIFFIIRPSISRALFTPTILALIGASVAISAVTNILFYRALKSDKLSEMQEIGLITRVPIILGAALFFADERNPLTIALAFISAVTLIWSHWSHGHIHLAKKTWPYVIWALIAAPFAAPIAKIILKTLDPITMHLTTSAVLAIFFATLYHKSIAKTPKQAWLPLIATNILTSIAWILYYYSFQQAGIVFTVLVFSLQPMLVYFASAIILKEKLHKKKTIAFIIILASIAAAQAL